MKTDMHTKLIYTQIILKFSTEIGLWRNILRPTAAVIPVFIMGCPVIRNGGITANLTLRVLCMINSELEFQCELLLTTSLLLEEPAFIFEATKNQCKKPMQIPQEKWSRLFGSQ